jgi:hypothetical protein
MLSLYDVEKEYKLWRQTMCFNVRMVEYDLARNGDPNDTQTAL